MALRYETRMEELGQVLVIAEKNDAFGFLRNAIAPFYKKIVHVTTLTEAKRHIVSERVFLLFAFTPFSDGGLDEIIGVVEKKGIPAVVVVGAEVYSQAIYRVRGSRVFVLTYPMKRGIIAQAVNIMYDTQMLIRRSQKEKDKLMERLNDVNTINRAKLLLIQQRGMDENEAHHEVERMAMDLGLTKRRAAEKIIDEIASEVE